MGKDLSGMLQDLARNIFFELWQFCFVEQVHGASWFSEVERHKTVWYNNFRKVFLVKHYFNCCL